MHRPAPLTQAATFALTFQTDANGFVGIFASPRLGALAVATILEQLSWLDETQSFAVALLVADAQGTATTSWAIPALPGGGTVSLWFKGISGPSLPLQTSPVVGGVLR